MGRAPWGLAIALVALTSAAVLSAPAEPIVSNDPGSPRGFTIEMLDGMDSLPGELRALPEVVSPAENPMTPGKVELGRRLFFDRRLSLDRSTSCATCHDPAKGYADGLPRAIGFGGRELDRHSPTVLNAVYNGIQFWDGRVDSLEKQAVAPILAECEMNMGNEPLLVDRLLADDGYVEAFRGVFGSPPSLELVGKAIACFERTLVTPDAPFDLYARGDKDALSDAQKRGLILFFGKASCTNCHLGVNFTDDRFHNLAVPSIGPGTGDLGRAEVTGDPEHEGQFKTPTLRNVELTAPYMHNGFHTTLEEVVRFYNDGGGEHPNKSDLLPELFLTDEEVTDLVEFMKSLTGKQPVVAIPVEGGDGGTDSGESRTASR